MTTAYQRLYEATEDIRDTCDWPDNKPTTQNCACCGRTWDETESPQSAIPGQYGNPGYYKNAKRNQNFVVEWLCETCQTVREPATQLLGVERYARGNPNAPIGQRLSMLPGAGAVITADSQLHLAVKPGHWEKFQDNQWARQGRIHVCQPLALLMALDQNGTLGPIENGIVFIENFGRQPDGLLARLRLTRAWAEVWANSEKGPRRLELSKLVALYKLLERNDQLQAAQKPVFWRPIRAAAMGHIDPKAINRWAEGTPNSQDIVATLPHDPHTRKAIHTMLQEMSQAYSEAI